MATKQTPPLMRVGKPPPAIKVDTSSKPAFGSASPRAPTTPKTPTSSSSPSAPPRTFNHPPSSPRTPTPAIPPSSPRTSTTTTTTASKPPSLHAPASSTTTSTTKAPPSLKKSRSEPAISKNSTTTTTTTSSNNNTPAKSSKTPPASMPKYTSALDVKRQAAQHDPAWQGKGKEVGLAIWRIEKFTVREIPKSTYGRFYNGDSYILLHTYAKHPGSQALNYDIHFWLGSKTTQDEAGTAAYKTVELDDYLGGMAVQHREVEKHESDLFLSYFSVPITIMEGGIESGFNHVTDLGTKYRPRLLQLKGKKQVRIVEVPLSCKSLNGGDAFVLDTGMHLYQWYGIYAGGNEKHKAAMLCRSLVDERKGEPKITVYHEGEKEIVPEFWNLLGGKGPIATASQGGDDEEFEKNSKLQKRLFKLSDASGSLQFTQIAEGKVKRSLLKSEDAFIFDTGTEVFAWIGLRTSDAERKHSLKYAQDYLTKFNRPAYISVCRILEGAENRFFESSFDTD